MFDAVMKAMREVWPECGPDKLRQRCIMVGDRLESVPLGLNTGYGKCNRAERMRTA